MTKINYMLKILEKSGLSGLSRHFKLDLTLDHGVKCLGYSTFGKSTTGGTVDHCIWMH